MITRIVPPGRLALHVCAVSLCASVLLFCSGERRRTHPNVVIVVADALRASNLSLYGYPRETAPNLADLSRASIVMEHHFVNAVLTPVSVSQLHTGLVAPPLLMDATPNAVPVRAVRDDMLVLPRFARQLGYRTGLVSSHPWFNERARLLRDFDDVRVAPYDPSRAYAPFAEIFPDVQSFLRAAVEAESPFLLYVHVLDTHRPFGGTTSPRFSNTEGWPRDYDAYDSAIFEVDAWTQRLILELQELGQWDDTVFVFTSDHGEELFELGDEPWNGGHGQSVSRAAVHVPLLLRLPRSTRDSGRRVATVTRHIDVAPTLARLIAPDVDLSAFRLDGQDLGPVLRGEETSGAGGSVVRAFRYRALHDVDGSLELDSWSSSLRAYSWAPDTFNYPRPVERDPAPHVRPDEVVRQFRRIDREYEDLPPVAPPAHSIIALALDPASTPTPTRIDDGRDQRWTHPEPQLLLCGLEETPLADLVFPWSPGRYRIHLRTSEPHRKQGFRNRLRVEVDRNRRPFDAPGPDADGLIDIGEHELGVMVRLSLQAKEGGVALTGLLIEASSGEPANRPSKELEKQLRALGYL